MNSLKKLAGQTAVYGLSSIIGRFLNYLLVPLHTRIFDRAEYGVVTEMYAYVAFLAVVLMYGMETAFFRFAREEQESKNVLSTAIISLLSTTALFIGVIIIFNSPIANWMGYSHHHEYIIWFALILGFDTLSAIPFAELRRSNKPIWFATVKLINIGINVFLNIFFLLLCPYWLKNVANPHVITIIHWVYNPAIGIGYVFISNLIASFSTLLLLSPIVLKIKFVFNTKLWIRMLKYALPLLIVGLAYVVNETLDRVLLKRLLSGTTEENLAQTGIYGACYKLSILMTLFIQAFRYAAEPFFFAESKKKNARDLYAMVMKYFIIMGCVIFLGVMLYIDIIKFFIGPQFYSGLKVVPILLMANLFLGIYFNLSVWYKLTDRTRYGAMISVYGAFVTILLNIILIPKMGYMGSAWTTLICYGSMVLISWALSRKYYPVRYEHKTIIAYIIGSVLLFFVSKWIATLIPSGIHDLVYVINTLLLLLFLAAVYWNEKRNGFNIRNF